MLRRDDCRWCGADAGAVFRVDAMLRGVDFLGLLRSEKIALQALTDLGSIGAFA